MATELQTGSTVRRIMLGAQLRSLREAAGITREDAGYTIRSSGSKISRMELGRFGFKERDVARPADPLRGDRRAGARGVAGAGPGGQQPGWWHRYGDVLPNWFQFYVGLEGAATLIRTYEIQFVPGCCRPRNTPGRSSCSASPTCRPEELERRVSAADDPPAAC